MMRWIQRETVSYLKVAEDKYKRLARENIRNYKATRDDSCRDAAEIYKDVAFDFQEIRKSVRIL